MTNVALGTPIIRQFTDSAPCASRTAKVKGRWHLLLPSWLMGLLLLSLVGHWLHHLFTRKLWLVCNECHTQWSCRRAFSLLPLVFLFSYKLLKIKSSYTCWWIKFWQLTQKIRPEKIWTFIWNQDRSYSHTHKLPFKVLVRVSGCQFRVQTLIREERELLIKSAYTMHDGRPAAPDKSHNVLNGRQWWDEVAFKQFYLAINLRQKRKKKTSKKLLIPLYHIKLFHYFIFSLFTLCICGPFEQTKEHEDPDIIL